MASRSGWDSPPMRPPTDPRPPLSGIESDPRLSREPRDGQRLFSGRDDRSCRHGQPIAFTLAWRLPGHHDRNRRPKRVQQLAPRSPLELVNPSHGGEAMASPPPLTPSASPVPACPGRCRRTARPSHAQICGRSGLTSRWAALASATLVESWPYKAARAVLTGSMRDTMERMR